MTQVTLYCEETPGLKLGPGTTSSFREEAPAGNVIVFSDGFAVLDPAEFPDWRKWISATGTPTIRVVDEAAGEATDVVEAIPCPECGRLLKSQFALSGHLRSHAPTSVTTRNAQAE